MSNFNEEDHPRDGAIGGQFSAKNGSSPDAVLTPPFHTVQDLELSDWNDLADAVARSVDEEYPGNEYFDMGIYTPEGEYFPAGTYLPGGGSKYTNYGFTAWTTTDEDERTSTIHVVVPSGSNRSTTLFEDGVSIDTNAMLELAVAEAEAVLGEAWRGWFGSEEAKSYFNNDRRHMDDAAAAEDEDGFSVKISYGEFEPTAEEVQTATITVYDPDGEEIIDHDQVNITVVGGKNLNIPTGADFVTQYAERQKRQWLARQ